MRKATDLLMRHLPLWISVAALVMVCWGPITNVVASTIGKPGGAASNYQTIEDDGVAVTQRPIFNIIGGTVADDAGNSRTNITFAAGGNVTTSATLTAGLPVIGNAGVDVDIGTRSGNTTEYATSDSTLANGNCVEVDANGNLTDSGAACGGGGGAQVYDITAPPSAGWSWLNQGTYTISTVGSAEVMDSAGGTGIAARVRSLSSTSNYTATVGVVTEFPRTSTQISGCGLVLYESGTGKAIIDWSAVTTGTNLPYIAASKYSPPFTFVADYVFTANASMVSRGGAESVQFLRVVDNGSTYGFQISSGSYTYDTITTQNRNDYFTVAADMIGWASRSAGADNTSCTLISFDEI